MNILAIDTATEACSVALWNGSEVRARFENAGRSHTERLMPMFQALLAESGMNFSQIDGIVCGVGPGSFAGVRIGVGFVKGLALARDLPVVGVSSLAMLAQREIGQGAGQVLAVIDARMSEVYFGAYRSAGGLAEPAMAESVCAPAQLPPPPDGAWVAAGTGWGTYPDMLKNSSSIQLTAVHGDALPSAQQALTLGRPVFEQGQAGSADHLTPVYLRNKVALTLLEQADLRRQNRG